MHPDDDQQQREAQTTGRTRRAAADAAAGAVPVVVVGAGLGGSAAAAFLARAGIRSIVLERRTGPTARPRAWVVSPRTLELLREFGLDREVLRRGSAGAWGVVTTSTLQDARPAARPDDASIEVSPSGSASCDQDLLEDMLRSDAEEHGAEVRWGQEVTALTLDEDGVEVQVAGTPPIRARYVVLAEGARAGLLTRLGVTSAVPEHGAPDPDARFDQVLFRSTGLDRIMAATPGRAFFCTDAGMIAFRRDLGRWQLQAQGRRIDDPSRTIADVVGQPVDVEVLDHSGWIPSARSADEYRRGDVFVIGDAAHAFPPSLGMGGNLAIEDAHDLAWKLAWVVQGRAGTGLLDSYEQERRPIGDWIMHASVDHIGREGDGVDLLTAQLGLGSPAGASIALRGRGDAVTVTDPRRRSWVVGARLPHRWLGDGRSTIDLATIDAFAVVGAKSDPAGPGALPRTQVEGLPDDLDGDAVWLIRPDGRIAAHVPVEQVPAVLDQILAREPERHGSR